VDHSIGVVAALVPILGYETSSSLAREALHTGKGPVELARKKGLLTGEQIPDIPAPERMANPLGR
jgi:aspartate ammonia-lyase